MRSWKADHHGKWAVAAVILNESACFPSHKPVHIMLPGKTVDDCASVLEVTFMFVAVEFPETMLLQVVVIVVTHLQPSLVFGDHPVLKSGAGVPRVEVHLSNG